MKSDTIKPIPGFTLIETLITIVILSIAALAIMTPMLVASSGVGAKGEAVTAQMAALAQGQAEFALSGLTALSDTGWKNTLLSLSGASPVTISPDAELDGKFFRTTESFVCLAKDLVLADPSCADGYARISVTITDLVTGKTFSLTFIKTKTGL